MINSKHRKAIITNWILSSREYRNIQLIKAELVDLIETAATELLTEDEKRYIEFFGIDNTRKQDTIDWHTFRVLSNEEKLNLPKLNYSDYIERTFWNSQSGGYLSTYDASLVKGVDRCGASIRVKDNTPVLFNNLEDFLMIERRNKLLYKNLLGKLRDYLAQFQSLKVKFDQLCKVLCSDNIGLEDLKEYYVELYNLRK